MRSLSLFSVLLQLFLFFSLSYSFAFPSCRPDQCSILLDFKNSFSIGKKPDPSSFSSSFCDFYETISYPKTSTWKNGTDCCLWDGVTCNPLGQVIGLNLNCSLLNGKLLPNSSLFQLTHLQRLDLSGNDFNGSQISSNFSQLVSLTHLSLDYCNFIGNVPSQISHLHKLISFHLSEVRNPLLSKENTWEGFTRNVTHIEDLHLVGVDMSSVPLRHLLENLSSSLVSLRLVEARLQGNLDEKLFSFPNLQRIYLQFNPNLTGYLPEFNGSSFIRALNLHMTSFTGKLPRSIGHNMHFLDLSSNFLQGQLHSSICNASTLDILNLSHNNFSGTIPNCFVRSKHSLSVLDLQMNSFSGIIPKSFEVGNNLRSLNLNGNYLEGSLPQSLVNCTRLKVLDLGNNQIDDVFPHWLQALEELHVLVLRGNKFHGFIPNFNDTRSHAFNMLRVLDLSSNSLKGPLPVPFFKSFKAMRNLDWRTGMPYLNYFNHSIGYYQNSIELTWKGLDTHLEQILTVLTCIDLSNNMFEGEIPQLVGDLRALKGLNFSHNRLTGAIPSSMGKLRNLEWLDLSSNDLMGKIPIELANLNFLSVLNLSSNQLEGCIPRGQQFDTFSSNSFQGNKEVRGFQLMIPCNTHEETQEPLPRSEVRFEFGWKPVALGYVCGAAFGATLFQVVTFTGKPLWVANLANDLLKKRKRTERKRRVRSHP